MRKAIEGAPERCWLSPISVWELGKLVERRRVAIDGEYRAWVEAAQRALPLREASVNREVAQTSLEVTLPHPDAADRFLAATALVYDLTLCTVDRRLSAARWLPTLAR